MATTIRKSKPARGARLLPGAGVRLGVPARPVRDRGVVITQPGAARLIAGIELAAGELWPDDRGCFSELFRFGAPGLARDFAAHVQVSAAVGYPGTIKAFHFHRRQCDLWAPLQGEFQVALFDLRLESPTFGAANTLFVGERRPWRIRIPPGVAHGYKILGPAPALMVYATDAFYDPGDEGRIAFDDAGLNYDWDTHHQ